MTYLRQQKNNFIHNFGCSKPRCRVKLSSGVQMGLAYPVRFYLLCTTEKLSISMLALCTMTSLDRNSEVSDGQLETAHLISWVGQLSG